MKIASKAALFFLPTLDTLPSRTPFSSTGWITCNTPCFSIWKVGVILWHHWPLPVEVLPAKHTTEITLSSSLVQVHGVGLLGYGHPHMSNAFQDIKCHVNIASPLLPPVTCQKPVYLTWRQATTSSWSLSSSSVPILDSSGVAIFGTTKEYWWENVGLLGIWPSGTCHAHLDVAGMGEGLGSGDTYCLSMVAERSWGWREPDGLVFSTMFCCVCGESYPYASSCSRAVSLLLWKPT